MLVSSALVVGLVVPAVSAAAASAPLSAAVAAAPTTLLDYQSGNFSQWSEQQLARPAQQAIVTTPARAGYPDSARFTVAPGDYTNGGTSAERSEVMASVAKTGNPTEGQTQWFSWSSFFPTGSHVSPGGWLIFTQWHQSGDSGMPNIALGLSKTTPVQVLAGVRGQNPNSPWSTEKMLGALPTNSWVDFTVGIKWSSNPGVGHFTVKMNGVLVMDVPAATLYTGMSAYLKQGIYRMSSPETQTIYDTATRIGATEASVRL